jgi:hypothetical protein
VRDILPPAVVERAPAREVKAMSPRAEPDRPVPIAGTAVPAAAEVETADS